ncbi:TlpA disulfide reductase family protein [Acidithiobacillus sp.]|uniref:TlpA family protein disulfide reductase n=1 Tax=Acidithiobacillus sp. TaxID=1872118 RepID=UPI0025C2EC36|nr:TlpA disulfide reductase family protein [Acidithiobacillus sp.]
MSQSPSLRGGRAGVALSGLVLVALLGLATWLWWPQDSGGVLRMNMPSLTLSDLSGQELDLDRYRGRVLLVNFWASDCPGCIAELPELIRLQQIYGERGLQVIGIGLPSDSVEGEQAVASYYHIPYPLLFDARGEAARAFGEVQLTPTTFLVNREGKIVYRQVGEARLASWERRIQPLLAAPLRSAAGAAPAAQ